MPRKRKASPSDRPRLVVQMWGTEVPEPRADAWGLSYSHALALIASRFPGWGLLVQARPLTPPESSSGSWFLSWQGPGPLDSQRLADLEAQLPLVLSSDAGDGGGGPFLSDELPDGLVRLRGLRAPLVVTAQQEAELEAILSEPDKEDLDRDVALELPLAPVGTVYTDPLESGDRWLDGAYGRLAEATKPRGKARVTKVDISDLKLILTQYRITATRRV